MNTITPPSGEQAKLTVAEKSSIMGSLEQLRREVEIIKGQLEANSVSDVPNIPSKKVPNVPYYTTGKYLKDTGPPTQAQIEKYMEIHDGKPPIGMTKGMVWLDIWSFYH